MTHVMLLFIFVCCSYGCVTIGAIALELTGMDYSNARFQALSAFSTTGFTTSISEKIVQNPVRRKIAIILIIFGNAGLVTIIGTFASSVIEKDFFTTMLHLCSIVVLIYILYRLIKWVGLANWMRKKVQAYLLKKMSIQRIQLEKLLHFAAGAGIYQVHIPSTYNSDKTLGEMALEENKVEILSLNRTGNVTIVPPHTTVIQPNDLLVCFGLEVSIQKMFLHADSITLEEEMPAQQDDQTPAGKTGPSGQSG